MFSADDDDDEENTSFFFQQRSIELAHLLRTDQTQEFLQLYDRLPSEWTGERLEKLKEYVRELQDYPAERFNRLYQDYCQKNESSEMSQRILHPSTLKREQYQERSEANNRAYDEIHSINNRRSTAVDSFAPIDLLRDSSSPKVDDSSFFDTFSSPRSRSSSSSTSSSSSKSSHSPPSTSLPSAPSSTTENPVQHSKLIPTHGFDSHGSSTRTKSSSDRSESGRAGSDSDEPVTERYLSYDQTPTTIIKQTSANPSKIYANRICPLPEQDTYQLIVQDKTPENELPVQLRVGQVPRFKLSVTHDPDPPLNETQLPSSPSSQTNRQESHHSAAARKSHPRKNKKRKQSQQQDIIRTESIPGHRGDLDVDELMIFIDGQSAKKPSTETTKAKGSTNARKSRKSSKTNTNGSSTAVVSPPLHVEQIETLNSEKTPEPDEIVVEQPSPPAEQENEVKVEQEPTIVPVKKPLKPLPPVVFMNSSNDIDLNGISFGFDLDDPQDQPSPPLPPPPPARDFYEQRSPLEENRYNQLSNSSSHIMSKALQLVYSEERRNYRSTDAFNLDQLTAYLALRWTDTIERYEQGDEEILFVQK